MTPSEPIPQSSSEFKEWLAIGIAQGFCSEPCCGQHDLLPGTPEEVDLFEAGEDPCLPAVRLWVPDDK